MQTEVKAPMLAAIIVAIVVIIGVITYFMFFHETRKGPEDIMAHMQAAYSKPGATGPRR